MAERGIWSAFERIVYCESGVATTSCFAGYHYQDFSAAAFPSVCWKAKDRVSASAPARHLRSWVALNGGCGQARQGGGIQHHARHDAVMSGVAATTWTLEQARER